ncbi:NADH-ubiquinone oxidoreductase-F iron-sulfur binding region domain-containing protein (plasmid) [Haloplanus ruber]|uniref:NADH-ubiquinone oxidoreductase-F iron-sulfur binding region domain-containing protein n=1 Tax=Haloplanus ruber TaxID=869892 RepID=A0ABD6CUS1_9EURY
MSTSDTIVEVGSTGFTTIEPLVMVTRNGTTSFYPQCSSAKLEDIVSAVNETGDVTAAEPDATVDHDPETSQLPVPEGIGLEPGVRDVTGACGWRRPTSPADHKAAGGFVEPDPEAVFDLGDQLRGRGWGDLCHDSSLTETWEAVRAGDGEKTIVVNAQGPDADKLLLGSAPFEVLDGAVALAHAVGGDQVVVYTSTENRHTIETVREAVSAYPDLSLPVDIATGPAEHRAAEPTMALEAIEGNHRLEARIGPPGPESAGLHGQPTLVHTPRTLAHLSVAFRHGEPRNTRMVTVRGDVEAPATVEVPETGTLKTAVDAVKLTGEFKAASVGGQFGGITDDLDIGVDPAALSEANLGTEGVVHLLADERCVVKFVGQRTRYAAEENCGRCVPCREGTTQLADLLRDVYDGTYEPSKMRELTTVMETSSICAFGVEAGRPARTAVAEFEAEFEAHADGRCPAGSCLETLEV